MRLKSKVWSNIVFAIPLAIAIHNQIFFHSLLILLTMTFSPLYHYFNETKFHIIDKISAYSIITYNLYLCYLSNFKPSYFIPALFFVLIGSYFLFIKKKDDYEWHISCAIITTLCLLSYITIP